MFGPAGARSVPGRGHGGVAQGQSRRLIIAESVVRVHPPLPLEDDLGPSMRQRFLSPAAGRLAVMEAQVWTTIGLLAASLFGALFYLGHRIDGLGNRIDGLGNRIDGLGARLDGRIDGLQARIDGLQVRIDGLQVRIEGLQVRVDGLDSRIDGLDSRVDGLSSRVDTLAARIQEQGAQLADRIYELAVKLDDHLSRHAG
jgi:chaperonin cofactor prefoldin